MMIDVAESLYLGLFALQECNQCRVYTYFLVKAIYFLFLLSLKIWIVVLFLMSK